MYKTPLFILVVLSVFFAMSAWAYDYAPEPTHVDGKVETIIKTNPTPNPELKPEPKTVLKRTARQTSKPAARTIIKPTPKQESRPSIQPTPTPKAPRKFRSLPPIRFFERLFRGLISGFQVDSTQN